MDLRLPCTQNLYFQELEIEFAKRKTSWNPQTDRIHFGLWRHGMGHDRNWELGQALLLSPNRDGSGNKRRESDKTDVWK